MGGRLVLHVTKRARAARHGTRTSQQRRFEAAAADTARCRRRGASANGVGWSAPRVGHADNRAKHAARREQGLRGRSAGSPRDEARARRAPRDENESATTVRSRSRRHGAVSAQRSLGQRRGVERAASWPRRQPRQARSAQRQVLCGRSAGSPRDEARARRAPRDENESATTVRSRSRRHGAVSAQRSLGQRRGVERAASWPRRQPRQARSAQRQVALWAVGWFSTRRSARAPRATGRERVSNDGSKPQPPTRRGVGAEEPRPTAWGGARRELATQTTAPSTQRAESKGSVGGRLVLHVTKRARAARHGTRTSQQRRFEAAAADTARCRWRGASANGVGWSTPRVGHADNRAKHAARRDKWLCGRSAGSPRDEARARRAPRDENEIGNDGSKPQPPTRRGVGGEEPRPTAWGGARRELATQTTAPSTQRAETSALWAVGWFSTRRSARAPRATGRERVSNDGSKPQPPTRRGVGGEEPRPTAWGGARRELATQTTAPSTQRAETSGSVGGRLVLHVTKRARAARHGTRTSQQRRFEAAAANTARCRRRGASANGVGWSAPRVGHADNRAKHAARREQGLCGRSAGSPRDEARARRAPRDENESATTVRSRSRRHGAVSAQRSLGQRRGVERAASWPRRQPRQARSAQRARAPWAVGWFST